MDVSDPQTLGFMVFGGFMFISAVGIALVSTLSMKETSYEEALAKQRRELVRTQPQRAEKKKKDKNQEKKNKAKKKEEQPDEKLSEPGSDGGEEPEVVASPEPESEPEPAAEPEPKPTPEPEPEPTKVSAATIESPPAPPQKEKKKKKPAKVEPAAVVETVAKEILVMAMAPLVDVSPVNAVTEDIKEPSVAKTEEQKETASKKKSKNKPEPVTDSSLLPYAELLATMSNTTLSDDQMHKLMEVLNQKAGVPHDSWQLASQKGDPLSSLKKQLEEKEKLVTTEQEGTANAKNRLRELNKELVAEKSKMASLDARLKAELSAQVQKVKDMRATMETANQEHLRQTQQLNQKIESLQEQLENGPNAQLARLQQENSILRDALNQATSQAESRQNAELARLRQDCIRLGREVTERTDALRADEERRKSLEAKMATAEQELSRSQLIRDDTERALKQRLEGMRLELEASKQEAAAVSELKGALASRDTELQELKVQLENQAAVQVDGSSEVDQLNICVQLRDEQVVTLEAELTQLRAELQLLTSSASQSVKGQEVEAAAGDETQKDGSGSETESDQPFEILEEDSQLLRLEEDLQQLREELHQTHNELKDKMSTLSTSEQREAELKSALTEVESRFAALSLDFQASLQVLFPGVSVEAEQTNWLELFTQKVQESESEARSAHSELQSRFYEAERKRSELQNEFDQNTKLLQETEAELQALQRRSEEEENLWRTKLSEAEQQKQTVLDQLKLLEDNVQRKRTETEEPHQAGPPLTSMMDEESVSQLKEQMLLLEAQLEKQLEEASFTQSCSEELAQVQSQLQQMCVRLQVEQEQRQQLDRQLQQAGQEVKELQQQVEAHHRSAALLKEATVTEKEAVQVKEETETEEVETVTEEETEKVETVTEEEEKEEVEEEKEKVETVTEEAVQLKEETAV
ncbi:ribosome-binding protein 1b [Anoplopoma fimbria]|uniref:ribosome-binding protein 1b n=1 Tax=Anoplopoma fimbria TaxID=229290 RepID=UPI0023EAD3CD|nr:ribosome-binding protein 1b [Anoplopoma fimbria]